MAEQNQQPVATYSDTSSIELQSKAMDLEHWWLGKFFGSTRNAPLNIAGLVLFVLMLPGVALLFVEGKFPAADYWKLITPAVTLILGYVFGRKGE